jgi:high-affinity K+ transport system ATPase subunit B
MDRALRANVITKSGKAVETAGDIDTLLLDKTGTITIGNRKATHFWPSNGIEKSHFITSAALSSIADETPEGKSIIELASMVPDSCVSRTQHSSSLQLKPGVRGSISWIRAYVKGRRMRSGS